MRSTKAGTEIKLTLGQAIAYRNGSPVTLAVPAKSINDRTMVPLRFVSEALGAQVDWNGYTEVITISSVPTSGTPPPTPPTQSTGLYVGSSQSDKYHLPTCRYAQAILPANQVWFASEAEALAAGYVPCGVCKP